MKNVINFETMLSRSFECGEAQEYLKERLGVDGYNNCNRWDTLKMQGGFTPKKCDCGVGEDGANKNIYDSAQEALLYADVTLKEEGIRLRVYKCPHGFGWHRTKKLL